MVDVLTKEQRSYNMSRIHGKWTRQERIIHNYLKGMKIKHRMHPDFPGRPDILLERYNTVIFLDGCFWHRCPKCFVEPLTNRKFWINKIKSNLITDKKTTITLKRMGYRVIRLWEHEIKENPKRCVGGIMAKIQRLKSRLIQI